MCSTKKTLVLYADGASQGNPGASAIGAIAIDERGKVVSRHSEYIGKATNNQAEYRAAIAVLELALRSGAERVTLNTDSELVVRQLGGQYKVRDAKLKPLFLRVGELLEGFDSFTIRHIPRGENNEAHRLAQQGLKGFIT